MLKRFKERSGIAIEEIIGQDRLAYSLSSTIDFYDFYQWPKGQKCPGSCLIFYDMLNGSLYKPFEAQEDVLYGKPFYHDGSYAFLKVDRQNDQLVLYAYRPDREPEIIFRSSMKGIDPYNLQIMGEGIHIVSQDSRRFESYYPERYGFEIDPHDTVVFINDDKVYLERWIEEGWDEENSCASEDYRFYHKVIIRDTDGKVLSEELGYLFQNKDGNWWMG